MGGGAYPTRLTGMNPTGTGDLKVDRGLPGRLSDVPRAARDGERHGYDGCWSGEIDHDPFLPVLLAAEHTARLQVGTSVAVAFARNPMTVAHLGWDLQAYSQGRFILGLGTQIRPHIEKRFSMPWSRPVARMREFVAALRAIWASWQERTRLGFDGEFYRHTLMTSMFAPAPQPFGFPKVFLAAVGESMTELCGEIADGMHAHAFTTPRYLREVTLPALQRGLNRAGRCRKECQLSLPVFVVTGETDVEMAAAASATRRQIAFYASTPAYRPVLELHGWAALQPRLHALSLRGEWDAMGALIDDEMLDAFSVVAPVADVAAALRRRCAGVLDRVLPALPPTLGEAAVTEIVAGLRSQPGRAELVR